ncbi:MAG: hypothetical protein GKR91_15865 [Pseudomonadales bacterium]|nr:hypothetical protein [Pseudomonadales bacterium]
MANQSNLLIAGQTYLVYLSNANCSKGFFDDSCKRYYQTKLLNSLKTYQVKLHSFTILDNEVFLLGTPFSPTGFTALVNYLNRAYTEYYNSRFERNIASWNGQTKTSLVQGYQLVLDCQKYIERSCLQENRLGNPGMYEFSSHCLNCFGGKSNYMIYHPAFSELIANTANPFLSYREFVATPFPHAYQMYLDKKLKHGQPLAKREKPMAIPIATKKRCPSTVPSYM